MPSRPSSRLRRRLLVLVPFVAVLLVAAAFAVDWTLNREFFPEGSPQTSLATSTTASQPLIETSTGKIVTTGGQGLRLKDLPATSLTGNFERCPECHAVLDTRIRNAEALTPDFAHGFHLGKGAECADCHETPTHALTGTRRPPMELCFSCHSQEDKTAPPGECAACHPAGFPLEPPSHAEAEWLPVREKIDSTRGKHTAQTPDDLGECSLCHSREFCTDCHQMPMPHPDEWQAGHPETAREVGGSACVRCHPDRKSCAACHHKGYDASGAPWVEVHFKGAEEQGVGKCIGCHSTKTCAHCHTTGEYREYD